MPVGRRVYRFHPPLRAYVDKVWFLQLSSRKNNISKDDYLCNIQVAGRALLPCVNHGSGRVRWRCEARRDEPRNLIRGGNYDGSHLTRTSWPNTPSDNTHSLAIASIDDKEYISTSHEGEY